MHIYRRWLASHQMLVDIRDAVQKEVARGVTEDQAVAVVPWPQYEKMQFLRRPKRDCCPAAVSATDRRAQVTGEMKKAANPDYRSYASLKKFAQRSARKSGGLTPVCSLRTMPNDEVGGTGDDDFNFCRRCWCPAAWRSQRTRLATTAYWRQTKLQPWKKS